MNENREVSAGIIEKEIKDKVTNVKYPEVINLNNPNVQQQLNKLIKELVDRLMVQQGHGKEELADMLGSYLVSVNEKGILSIKFENYSYFSHAAHGLTVMRSLTADLATGQTYEISDLFKRNSSYRIAISDWIKEEINKRKLPMIAEFERINDEQSYYLTPNALVIYWQAYEYTPYVAGLPEFPIPSKYLANLIDPEGSLGRLYFTLND